MATPTTKPSLHNNFYHMLECWDESTNTWHDPKKDPSITPHIPAPADQVFHAVCDAEFQKKSRFPETLTIWEQFLLHKDCIVVILTDLDLKTLLNCSEVSKCFYLATKAEIVWEAQLFYFLPNVTPTPLSVCIYSTSQQFQIDYKAVKNAQKPFIAKLEHERAIYLSIRGEKLEQTWNQFQAAGGMEAYERIEQRHAQGGINEVEREEIKASSDFEAWKLYNRYCNLVETTYWLKGDKDTRISTQDADRIHRPIKDGALETQLQHATYVLVPDAFNDQAAHEKAIRDSEKALRDRVLADLRNKILAHSHNHQNSAV